jgi:PBP1b-binding outer membrane lipoprotein LpoB
MLKRFIVAGALAAAVLASGCASVQMAAPEMDTSAKSYAVKPNKANIYVYRNEVFGAAIKLPVLLNGRAVGDTASKTFMLLEVDPGSHTVVSKSENDAVLKVDAAAGRNYFIWQEVKMGMLQAGSMLHLVDEVTGKAGVAECKLIQPQTY